MMPHVRLLCVLSLVCLTACQMRKAPKPPQANSIADADAELGADLEGGLSAGDYAALVCDKPETFRGLRAWRRLSNSELINTIQDIFGSTEGVDFSTLINDIPKKEAFDTIAIKTNYVYGDRFKAYMSMASSLSSSVNITQPQLFPCLAEGRACVEKRLPEVGGLAWRRPLEAEEINELLALYDSFVADGTSAEDSTRLLLQALVLSHHFLYRSELGDKQGDGSYLLNNWELASALSYILLRRPPDSTLRQLAQQGELQKPEVIRSQAERLLADARAREAWGDFASMWLDANRVQTVTKAQPEFNADLKNKLAAEVKEFFVNTMFDAEVKTYGQLINSSYTIVDPSAAWIYDSTAMNGRQLTFAQEQRRGVLGQAGFLASHALPDQPNPITRGVFVAERLLCVGFAPAPPVPIPEPKPGITNKERFRVHTQGSCASCHATIDAIGFALENFDALGKFRTEDAGQPIVVDSLLPIDGKELMITTPQGLSETIAQSRQGLQCFVRQNFRYGLGRLEYAPRVMIGVAPQDKQTVQSELDRCQIEAIANRMQENNGDMKTAILELVTSPAFRTRLIGALE